MSQYSFNKEAKVYIVHNGLQYNIDISTITFNQTFREDSYQEKTIQTQNMFEQSVINKVNPANFSLTFPMLREADLRVLFDRALDFATFDLYIATQQDVFKVETCIITNATFLVERLQVLGITISGQASKLTRVGDFGVFVIPGTIQTRSGTRTYNLTSALSVTLAPSTSNSRVLNDNIASVTIELQNNIKWTPYDIVTGGCDPVTIISFPTTFTVTKRILSGTIVRYLTDLNNEDLLNFDSNIGLNIQAGQTISGVFSGFNINMVNCSFTNRLGTGNIYTQSYDWRLTQNPTNLSDIFTYTIV